MIDCKEENLDRDFQTVHAPANHFTDDMVFKSLNNGRYYSIIGRLWGLVRLREVVPVKSITWEWACDE